MTPAELYTIVRNQCAESSSEFWSESEIYSLMSNGERIIAQKLGLKEVNSSFTSVTSTKTYAIGTVLSLTVGPITRVTYDSYHLKRIDINQLDDVEGNAYGGITLVGQPRYYYRYGGNIGFSPTPDSDKSIEVFFKQVPPVVTTASTYFTIQDDYTGYIEDWVLYRMFLKDQQTRDMAIVHKNQWDENLKTVEEDFSRKKYRDGPPQVIINSSMVTE